MQFLVIGRDGKDKKAEERRMVARSAHLKLGDKMEKADNRWYGCAILDNKRKMIGSMAVMDFQSRKDLEKWMKSEPYATGGVWKTIEVYKCDVKKPWKFNRAKKFFDSRS